MTTDAAGATTARLRLAYILAPSHSGSTLLALLLARHPEVCTVGELGTSGIHDPRRYRCSCGATIDTCEFWQRIASRMTAQGVPFEVGRGTTDYTTVSSQYARRLLRPLHRGPVLEWARDRVLGLSPVWRSTLARAQRANAALARSVCEETGATVLVDSSKIGVRLKYLLRNDQLDVRVIQLVRDGRAVAASYMNPADLADARDPTQRGAGTGHTAERARPSLTHAAHEWRRACEEAQAALARVDPARQTHVRYETLCTETDATLRRLFAFLGVSGWSPSRQTDAKAHHVIGNGMRLDGAVEARLDTRWKAAFTTDDARRFERAAGDLNRRLGYR